MKNKKLHILRSICIANNKVVCDGKFLDGYDNSNDFKVFGKDLYKKLSCNYPKYYKMDNLCKLSFLAGELLTNGINLNVYPPEQTALILANSLSTLDTDINFVNTLELIPSPAVFVYTLPNITIGELCIRHGWKGENLFMIQKQFEVNNLIDQTTFLFTTSNTKLCIAGWTNYLSATDYKACFWLITDETWKTTRKFSKMELLNDYNIQ
jgi:hypothetical protein